MPADRPIERAAAPPPRPTMPPIGAPRGQEPVSEYAKRPAHQGLDPHGRQAPVHNSVEEDQLDIPAFLRRQAN
jgi:cell division protein FtsZ